MHDCDVIVATIAFGMGIDKPDLSLNKNWDSHYLKRLHHIVKHQCQEENLFLIILEKSMMK